MQDKMNELKIKIEQELKQVDDLKTLNEVKVKYLSKKGPVTELSQVMKEIPNEEKKAFGQLLNSFKSEINSMFDEVKIRLEQEALQDKLASETIDITLPSKKVKRGSKHPMTRIQEQLEDLFVSMGYDVYEGPEIETDENCFQRLNLPYGHPARDTQDTFYLENEEEAYMLRTQTSTAQVRAMLENEDKGPMRIVCPGKTYRRDDDATHSHQFMQFEGLVIGKDISLANLKGTLELFSKKLLGDKTEIRFRPSYFPFTEPSVEVDVTCFKCHGKGCNLCKDTGWIEVLGAGIVHPNVLKMNGYDPEKYTGFAFGPGLDRFAMFKYGITDIRYIYGNDIRFLEQFDRKDED